MKISFENYPFDIIVCFLWNFILILLIFLNIWMIIRIILGLVFILFIPGYIFIFVLFPTRKKENNIDIIERIALSFGVSIALVPFICYCLNYTPWGIRLKPLILFLSLFVFGIGTLAVSRWFKTSQDERFILSVQLNLPKSKKRLDRALTILITGSIFIMAATVVYVVITPKTGEHFTEFYLLNPNYKIELYQKNLSLGENITGIIGILNHEYRTINYTIEVWLLNQTIIFNTTTSENNTIYNNLWFIDKINITLNHKSINLEENWKPQWEYNYTFNITQKGYFKLVFLLYTSKTPDYITNNDYKKTELKKINTENTDAYRNVHLWIKVV